MFCRYCGREISDEAVFCHLCGKDQQIASSNNDTQPIQTQGDRSAQPASQPTAQPVAQSQPVNIPPVPQRPSTRVSDPSQYPVLHSVGVGAGRIRTSWILNIAFIFLISILEFIWMQTFKGFQNIWGIVSVVSLSVAANVFSVFLLIGAIRFTLVAKSTSLNITETGIYGVGGNKNCKVRKNISFDYSQITRAFSQNDKMLFIEAGSETYCFPIDKAEYYADIIKDLQKSYNA